MFIPSIATAFTAQSCFVAVITGAGSISSSYPLHVCLEQAYSNGVKYCSNAGIQVYTDTFERPFIYHGGCSSTILVYYIPLFINTYMVETVLLPFAMLIFSRYPRLERCFGFPSLLWAETTTVQNRTLLRVERFVSLLFVHLTLTVTFGVASPPLVVIILLCVIKDIFLYAFLVRRYIAVNPSMDEEPQRGFFLFMSYLITILIPE